MLLAIVVSRDDGYGRGYPYPRGCDTLIIRGPQIQIGHLSVFVTRYRAMYKGKISSIYQICS
jgi:hypothetical protein